MEIGKQWQPCEFQLAHNRDAGACHAHAHKHARTGPECTFAIYNSISSRSGCGFGSLPHATYEYSFFLQELGMFTSAPRRGGRSCIFQSAGARVGGAAAGFGAVGFVAALRGLWTM